MKHGLQRRAFVFAALAVCLLYLPNALLLAAQGTGLGFDPQPKDSHPFRDKKVPTVTIHSLTKETFPLIRSSRDDLMAIHADYLYDSYRMIAAYLNYLDKTLN